MQIAEKEPSRRSDAGDYELRDGSATHSQVNARIVLNFPIDRLDCMVTSSGAAGMSLAELIEKHHGMRGVFVPRIRRGSQELPITLSLRLDRGDVVSLVGLPDLVDRAEKVLGYGIRMTTVTDMFTLGIGIAIGCLIGLPAVFIGSVKLALSSAVGTLLVGLLFGWFRSVRPNLIGQIPEAALSFMTSFRSGGICGDHWLACGPPVSEKLPPK
jgi:putative transport protein